MPLHPSLILALPVLAAAAQPQPVTAELRDLAVRMGAGMEPMGAPVPAALSGTLILGGLPKGATPSFRLWRLKAEDLKAVAAGRSPARMKGAVRLPHLRVEPGTDGLAVTGPWLGEVDPADRLLVEVWVRQRRVAWAAGAIQAQYLATGPGPRSGEKT